MHIEIFAQELDDDIMYILLDNEDGVETAYNVKMSDENRKAASLEFDVSTHDDMYIGMVGYSTLVSMYIDGECAFFGRVIQADRSYGDGGALIVHTVCESALGFLADSTVFIGPAFPAPTNLDQSAFVAQCIGAHNAGFGRISTAYTESDRWINVRVSGGSVVPWEMIDYTYYNASIEVSASYDYGNDTDLLSRVQRHADDYGLIFRTQYYPDSVDMRTTSGCKITVLCSNQTVMSDRPIQPDVIARHGINIESISASGDVNGINTCVYATNRNGNEAFAKNDTLVAKYGYRQARVSTESTSQSEVQSEANRYAAGLAIKENVECDLGYIDLSVVSDDYVRPKVGQLWHVHSAPLGIHLRGWVKSCTWSADEPWSSHIVLHYCTEIEAE